jgi:hypothetical protein
MHPFLKSKAPIRVLCGGNRIGKTSTGASELISYAMGHNKWRGEKYETPNVCWAISIDHSNLGVILRDRIRSMLPPGYKEFRQPPRFVLPNGSEIHMKSADPSAGFEAFQGAGIKAALFDEEPVGNNGRQIFHEVFARRAPGVPLRIMFIFTPLQGLSWAVRELLDPESPDLFPGVDSFKIHQDEALKSHGGFWEESELMELRAGYSGAEYDARVKGQFGLMSGNSYFDGRLLEETRERVKNERGVRHSIRSALITGVQVSEDADGPLSIYRPPLKDRQYIMGVDCAGGIGQDYSVCSVWDRKDLALVASWVSNRIDPHEFGSNGVLPLAKYYNNALVVLEVNSDHGGSVLNELRSRYHNLYRQRKWDSIKREYRSEWGWRTLSNNRTAVYDALAKALREGEWTPSVDLLKEMSFIIKREGERIDHLDGYHDDLVFASGLALAVHFDQPVYVPKVSPRRHIPATETGWMSV